MALGRQAEEKRHFEKLLKGVPDDPVAHMYLGEMSFAGGAYAEAVAHYEQLVAKGYPDAYRAGFNLTLAYVNTRNYAAAIRTMHKWPANIRQRSYTICCHAPMKPPAGPNRPMMRFAPPRKSIQKTSETTSTSWHYAWTTRTGSSA